MFSLILCYLLTILPYSEQKAPVLQANGDGLLHIYALPVGQGDGTVIQCPNGDIAIVDLGSTARQEFIPESSHKFKLDDKDKLQLYMTDEELNAFLGTTSIKYVFITHADRDHYNLFEKIDPKRLATVSEAYVGCEANSYSCDIKDWLIKYFPAPKAHYNPKLLTEVTVCTSVKVKVVAINTDTGNPKCTNSNGMALRLEYGTFSLFLPGDLEDRYSKGKSGVLKTVSDSGEKIQSTVYRLSHHGAWPKANKPFFLQAIQPKYVFSSSQLPPGKYGHPRCDLYNAMIDMTNKGQLPIVKYSTAKDTTNPPPQKDYFCGGMDEENGSRRFKEVENVYGIFTTAVADKNGHLVNYFIQIDSDGKNILQVNPKLWR